MRGRHTCKLCPRKGRIPVGHCHDCGNAFCPKHGTWDSEIGEHGSWLCTKCARQKAA